MKEKKSNIKNGNYSIEDEQKQSIIRLIGLFLIVYGILCFTSGDVGCVLTVPFSFLFGSFTPISLLTIIVIGCYLLVSKRMFSSIKAIQWVLISLILIFYLCLATPNESNQEMSFLESFEKYIGENGVYRWNYRFISEGNDANTIMHLGGGMIGYMIYGLINSLTGKNYVITQVICWICFVGLLFILLVPFVKKLIKFIKKCRNKALEKKAIKNQKKKEEQASLKKEKKSIEKQDNNIDNVETVEFDFSNNNSQKDSLVEPTKMNIEGDNYSYTSTIQKHKKLDGLLSQFDDEIYSLSMKHPSVSSQKLNENKEVKLAEIYSSNFNEFDEEKNEKEVKEENKNDEVIVNDTLSDEVIVNDTLSDEVKLDQINFSLNDDIDNKKENNNDIIIEDVKIEDDSSIDVNEYLTKENEKLENLSVNNVKVEENQNSFDFNNYQLPPLFLLKEQIDNGITMKNEEIAKEKAEILMEKMRELNVSASINNFVVGPSVTRFEISLAPGVRVNSFTNLQEDFKLALGVNSIRIESPIPGKSAIGIEIPNEYRAMVSLKEIISKMPNKKHKLYVPIGKDIAGTPLSFPICDMPHCLISGATNSGKSVCANTIILSILMNYKPNEVKFIMVDPKRVEMLFYKDIPHLLCPIITDSEKARVALDKLCIEMDKRFTTFSQFGVKNIASYNEIQVAENKEKMPFIILVVDEFAELMLSKNRVMVEERIQKLAQLGRAAGIHLILATQRPDVNVIPGTIKTNLPCRLTFRLSSLADSRTVIDLGGAEKLLNNGDMLLLTPDFTGLRRVQGVYVSDKEISDVVEYCKKQCPTQYDVNFMDLRSEEEKQQEERLQFALESNAKDEQNNAEYEKVKELVIKEGKASASFLVRKLAIGYGKAGRYIDMLEDEGIIGPENGSKPREVLISKDEKTFDEVEINEVIIDEQDNSNY